MPISQANQVDYLFKKIGYGVTTTANASVKSPSNESIPSPLTLRGDNVWVQSGLVPSTQPSSNSSVVTVYADSLSSTVKTTNDATSPAYQTWKTGVVNWIDPSFGSTYQVKVFWANSNVSNPQTVGTQLYPDGTGNDDEWFFDYDSGVLTFPDIIPTTVNNITGNSIFIVGSTYAGAIGLANVASTILGNVGSANVAYFDNVVVTSSSSTFYPALYTATSGNLISYSTSNVTVVPSTGNVTAGNVTATQFNGNVQGTILTASQPDITYVGNLTTANVTGNLIAGNVSTTQVNLTSLFATGNLSASNVNASIYGNVNTSNISSTGNIYITPGSGSIVDISSTSAVLLPVGSTLARPTGVPGYIRYNQDLGTVEYYTGTGWVPVTNSITGQDFSGDGATTQFTLNQPATTVGVLVSINGTVQEPTVAYTVSGTIITFTEAPLSTDTVDIRFLASSVINDNNFTVVNEPYIAVGTSNTIINSANVQVYRGAEYTISSATGADSHMAQVILTQFGGVTAINVVSNINTGANTITYSANISGTNFNLIARGTTSSNLRIQTTYFAV